MNNDHRRLRSRTLGLSLATFWAIAYLACLALALIIPNLGLHTPWLQFYPGFSWTAGGIAIGLIESVVYGLIAGAVFARIYNYYDRLFR